MTELKPCPFCGGPAFAWGSQLGLTGKLWYVVFCLECGIRTHWYQSKQTAIKKWNRREGESDA